MSRPVVQRSLPSLRSQAEAAHALAGACTTPGDNKLGVRLPTRGTGCLYSAERRRPHAPSHDVPRSLSRRKDLPATSDKVSPRAIAVHYSPPGEEEKDAPSCTPIEVSFPPQGGYPSGSIPHGDRRGSSALCGASFPLSANAIGGSSPTIGEGGIIWLRRVYPSSKGGRSRSPPD